MAANLICCFSEKHDLHGISVSIALCKHQKQLIRVEQEQQKQIQS
jgi:hypothetical protein